MAVGWSAALERLIVDLIRLRKSEVAILTRYLREREEEEHKRT